jgi:hypothetical protein
VSDSEIEQGNVSGWPNYGVAFILVLNKCHCEDSSHLGYDAVSLDEWFRTFKRNILPASSRAVNAFETLGKMA